MQRRNDVSKQINGGETSHHKMWHYQWRPWLMVISALAFTMLACSSFNTTSSSSSEQVLIRKTLPTLTPTTVLSPSVEPNAEIVAVVPPTLLPEPTSSPTPVATPALPPPATDQNSIVVSQLTALVVLNARSGPGIEYQVVGQLNQGQSTQVIGRNPEGTWWQIAYPSGSSGSAWVSADNQYSTISSDEAVQIAQAPDLPTATNTPLATNTPTEIPTTIPTATVSIQQTRVPRPTNTPVPPAVVAIFKAPANVRPSVD